MMPIGLPTPIEAIRFRMDQLGLKTIDLAKHMDTTRARAGEVLNGKRQLTLAMIPRLVESLGIDAGSLVGSGPCPPRRLDPKRRRSGAPTPLSRTSVNWRPGRPSAHPLGPTGP